MIIQFKVKNFLSLKDEAVLNTEASNITEFQDNNVFTKSGTPFLKSIAIYGANASGKSNFLKAINFFQYFVHNSYKLSLDEYIKRVHPFKFSTNTETLPSEFEMIVVHNNMKYRYGFSVDNTRIHHEWLFSQELKKRSREVMLFIRKSKITYGNAYRNLGIKQLEESEIRSNVLLLTKLSMDYDKIKDNILNAFRNINIILGYDQSYGGYTRNQIDKDSNFKEKIIHLLKAADIQINDIFFEKRKLDPNEVPEQIKNKMKGTSAVNVEMVDTLTKHNKYDTDKKFTGYALLNLEEDESRGTNQLFNLLGPIIDTIENNKVLIVDELDSSLHPHLTQFIVKLFNSLNNKEAQLIFTTHDVSLLDANCLRRDQIWFTELDLYGASNIFSLADFKTPKENTKIRKDANYLKQYMLGRYGAIPLVDEVL